MEKVNLITIALAVSLDAFAVAIGKGLTLKEKSFSKSLSIGGLFGFFQMGMTLLGFCLGQSCLNFIKIAFHWLTFLLLSIVGVNMILEGFHNQFENIGWDLGALLVLSLATSLDAFSVGIALAFLKNKIILTSVFIGIVTLCLSFIGTLLGYKLGTKIQIGASTLGGIILILIGCSVLLERFEWF